MSICDVCRFKDKGHWADGDGFSDQCSWRVVINEEFIDRIVREIVNDGVTKECPFGKAIVRYAKQFAERLVVVRKFKNMERCDKNHREIFFVGGPCPLCVANRRLQIFRDELEKLLSLC